MFLESSLKTRVGRGRGDPVPRPALSIPDENTSLIFSLTNVHSNRDCKEGGDCNLKKKEKKKKRTKLDEKYPRKSLPASPAAERVRLC